MRIRPIMFAVATCALLYSSPAHATGNGTCTAERAIPGIPTKACLVSFAPKTGITRIIYATNPFYSMNKAAQYYSDPAEIGEGEAQIYQRVETMPAGRRWFTGSHGLEATFDAIAVFLSNNFPPVVANVLMPPLVLIFSVPLLIQGILFSGDGPPSSEFYAVNATGSPVSLSIDSGGTVNLDAMSNALLFFPRGQHFVTASSAGQVIDTFWINSDDHEIIVYNASGANEFTLLRK